MAEDAKVVLRLSLPSDIAAITDIYAYAVRHGTASFELCAPDTQEMARRQESLLSKGYPYLVAESGREVLGYAYAGPYRPRPAYAHTLEDSVYVRADAQRRGVGLALLRRLADEAEARGFRQMIAVIGDSANQPSIRLHECVGFIHTGTLRSVGWKHGRWLDSVLMQRTLGLGATADPSCAEGASDATR
ncbi:MAG TPA: GNAT family N-acetyltransferase [Steroidobacteraceae bacterium]|jgi:phosphinothricin acetyltransferase